MIDTYPWFAPEFAKVRRDAEANRQTHAMLVSGPPGVGVEQFAELVAHYRLCQVVGSAEACGQCKACQLLAAGSHPDLRTLSPEGASQSIRVDQVRALVNFVGQTAQIGDWKLVIIRMAHRMNPNAANALLKMLEEPAGNSLLILATERPQLLLPTVRSRCAHVRLPMPSSQQAADYLTGAGIETEQARSLVAQIGPRPLQIQQWLHAETLPQWQLTSEKLRALDAGDAGVIATVEALKGLDLGLLLDWTMQFLSARSRALIGIDRPRALDYLNLYDRFLECRRDLDAGSNPNTQLALEALLLDWHARR